MFKLMRAALCGLIPILALGCSSEEDPNTPVKAEDVRQEIKDLNQQRHKEVEESSTNVGPQKGR